MLFHFPHCKRHLEKSLNQALPAGGLDVSEQKNGETPNFLLAQHAPHVSNFIGTFQTWENRVAELGLGMVTRSHCLAYIFREKKNEHHPK